MEHRILIIALLVIAVGCKKEFKTSRLKQEIFFEATFMNYAWVYQHSGFMVDSAGRVRGYNLPKDWNFVDSDGFITSAAMKGNINKLNQTSVTINEDTLLIYYNKLTIAAQGEITKPKNVMADAGTASYWGYIFDSETERYQRVLLNQFGDVSIENKSTEAKEIYNWLIRINTQVKTNSQ